MDRLIFVSSDSHAGVPNELWPEYLDPQFHDLLPGLREDNEVYPTAIFLLSAKGGSTSLPEVQDAHANRYHGLHDAHLRLADMDREGVAAELIYHGDFRLGDMFHNTTNRTYPLEAWDAARGPGTGGRPTTSGSRPTGSCRSPPSVRAPTWTHR